MKKFLVLLVLVAVVAACVWRVVDLWRAKTEEARKASERRPVPVRTAAAVAQPMPFEIRTFGTVEASSSVTVRAQVTGILAAVGFQEGDEVQAGQVLFRIDPRPFEADLHQAEAALARTDAQLANASNDTRRVLDLYGKKFASESEHDAALTSVASLRATRQSDAANVENARIRLGYCEIVAPLAGRVGRRLIDPGNLVTANATALVTINQIAPAAVSFAIPQQELPRVQGRAEARDLLVTACLAEDAAHPERGLLTFLDNSVDRTTGMIALKAGFPNAAHRLWPGQFVTVSLVVSVETNALVIPYKAVQNGQKGTYVYVVRSDGTVTNRQVQIARTIGEESVVGDGLASGEVVVTDGQQRIGPGSIVTIAPPATAKAAAP